MADMSEWKNQLYFGDNLDILRQHIPAESVDLIYLDPPFNSKATYNVLFAEKSGEASAAQITAFDDTWHWGQEAEEAFHDLITTGPVKLSKLIDALRSFLGSERHDGLSGHDGHPAGGVAPGAEAYGEYLSAL